MNMMNDLQGDYLDWFVLIFLDDILIYSANVNEHAEHQKKVLQVLQEHRLYAKASKCVIFKHSVEFLGQQIFGGGMTPTEAKLTAIYDWVKPQNVRDIQSFLGFVNIYKRFVKNFARVEGPLMDSTQKGVLWQ